MEFLIAVVDRRIAIAQPGDRQTRIGNCTVEKSDLILPGRDYELARPHYELRKGAHGIIVVEVPGTVPGHHDLPWGRGIHENVRGCVASRVEVRPNSGNHGRREPTQQRLGDERGQPTSESHKAIGADEQAVIRLTEKVDGLACPEG